MTKPQPKHMPYPVAEHRVRVACLDPVALAYEWIDRYAESISHEQDPNDEADVYYSVHISIDKLIDTAMGNLNEEGRRGSNYISTGNREEYLDDIFWDKLAVLKGITIPEEKRNNFFSCAC